VYIIGGSVCGPFTIQHNAIGDMACNIYLSQMPLTSILEGPESGG